MFKSKEENLGRFIPCRFSEESEKSACDGKTHPAIKTNKEYKQNLNVKVKNKKILTSDPTTKSLEQMRPALPDQFQRNEPTGKR